MIECFCRFNKILVTRSGKMIRQFFSWFESTYWWRIAFVAKIFTSLAIKSLEGCFGSVKERSERITLFTLLMTSCYRLGKHDKALLYAENLLELVPASAAAFEMKIKIKGRPAEDDYQGAPELAVDEPAPLVDNIEAGAQKENSESEPPQPCEDCSSPDQNSFQPVEVEPKESDMVWYDEEEETRQKTEGVAEVMNDLFNDFFMEKPAASSSDSAVDDNINQKKNELFAQLDALEAPEMASEAWLNCSGNTQREQLFKELDQGR